jgi:hypothetical protein
VHPLVLLNATDHFTRTTAGDLNRRVVGILLGEVSHGKVDVTNSYAGERAAVALVFARVHCTRCIVEGALLKRSSAQTPALFACSAVRGNRPRVVLGSQLPRGDVCDVQESQWCVLRFRRLWLSASCLQRERKSSGGTAQGQRSGHLIWVRPRS